ncbi:MAG: hypothetical protein FJ303_04215 [Planctomycetes bacterium]|nr:hypothetical protein [Planctomycetota bacterium]
MDNYPNILAGSGIDKPARDAMRAYKREPNSRLVENLDDLARLNVHIGAPLQLAEVPRHVAADAQRRAMIKHHRTGYHRALA